MNGLKSIPWSILIIIAIFLAIAPFNETPHFIQKINLLLTGELTKAVDIFDLCLHSTPLVLIILKLIVTLKK